MLISSRILFCCLIRFAILHRDHLKWLSRLRDAHGKEIPDAVARDGVSSLLAALRYDPSEYQMGRTKVFIRHPETVRL